MMMSVRESVMRGREAGRKGSFLQVASGRVYWPLDPRQEEVHIEDIAASLARQCRFAGHLKRGIWHYSVAQHSVLCSLYGDPAFALDKLLHDASEAFCVDVPRPLKHDLAGYREIEDRNMSVIAAKFGIAFPLAGDVHEIDGRILADERRSLITPNDLDDLAWGARLPGLGIEIIPRSAEESERRFLQRFWELWMK